MPDEKQNLYIYEAIELRNQHDRHIKVIERITEKGFEKERGFLSRRDEEEREPSADFYPDAAGEELKKLQTKRVMVNQAIQASNFAHEIEYRGERISLSQGLEIRKNLLSDIE